MSSSKGAGQNKTQENALEVFYREMPENANEVIWQVHTEFPPSQTNDPPWWHSRYLPCVRAECHLSPRSRLGRPVPGPALVRQSCTALAWAAGQAALWESPMWAALLRVPHTSSRAAFHLSCSPWSLLEPCCPSPLAWCPQPRPPHWGLVCQAAR